MVFNYIEWKGLCFFKVFLVVIEELKRCDDIVIIKLDKGLGVVVMDKYEYLCLLLDVFVNDISKFCVVFIERLKSKGRLFKYYYFFLEKEKLVELIVCRILLLVIVDFV